MSRIVDPPGSDRWGRLWQAVGARGDPRPCYERLMQAYSESHWRYHDFQHVTDCLAVFETAVLIDVDLSILGQSEARFEEYERQIREEYSWVLATIFAAKRAEILEGFLTRERIYTTDVFHDRFERNARKNLQDSLRRLDSMIA